MTSSLEKALEGTWKNKEKFYEETKYMNIMEIIEKIEGKKFSIDSNKEILMKDMKQSSLSIEPVLKIV